MLIGAAEKAGSGIDKIKNGWNSQHWRSPIVREQMRPDRVMWVLPMLSLIPEKSLERLKNKFGASFSKFSKLEIQALVTAGIEGYVDNARMRQITGQHASDITKLLQNLVSHGILQQNGQGRWTRYCLSADEPNPLHIDDHSLHNQDTPSERWTQLIAIAKPAREKKRMSPKEMEAVIIE